MFGDGEGIPVSFDRVVPEEVARSVEDEGGGRLAIEPTVYRLAGQALRAPRWLSDASAEAFDRLLEDRAD